MEVISLSLLFLFLCWTNGGAFSTARIEGMVKYSRESTLRIMNSVTDELNYGGLHHCGIIVSDVEKSKEFYMAMFGFTDESHLRPLTLPYPGAVLQCGTGQIHLMQLSNPDPTDGRPHHGGRDRHVAMNVNNIDIIRQRLLKRNVE